MPLPNKLNIIITEDDELLASLHDKLPNEYAALRSFCRIGREPKHIQGLVSNVNVQMEGEDIFTYSMTPSLPVKEMKGSYLLSLIGELDNNQFFWPYAST